MHKHLLLLAAAIASPGLFPLTARAVNPINTVQPSTAINFSVEVSGIYQNLGTIRMFAGTFPLGGFAANGAILPINQNQALFSQLGTTFGGNGVTTFALPNFMGDTLLGDGQGPGLPNYTLGQTIGTTQLTLGLPQMPPSVGGGGQPFSNSQPTAAVHYMMAIAGSFPSLGGGGETLPVLGQVFPMVGNILPQNFIRCDGQILPISQYTALFAILGTSYGGNGTTNFMLPDLRGRTVVGAGNGPGLTPRQVGDAFGTPTITLNTANLPAPYGPNFPFSNVQPSLSLHYMIAINGIYPQQGGLGFGNNDPFLGEISLFAGVTAPLGWAFCDGQILPIGSNSALFSVIGTTYGGDGQNNFALPNLDGRVAVGQDNGSLWPLARQAGTEDITLLSSQIPAVPEPATLALLTLAATPLLLRRRRA